MHSKDAKMLVNCKSDGARGDVRGELSRSLPTPETEARQELVGHSRAGGGGRGVVELPAHGDVPPVEGWRHDVTVEAPPKVGAGA